MKINIHRYCNKVALSLDGQPTVYLDRRLASELANIIQECNHDILFNEFTKSRFESRELVEGGVALSKAEKLEASRKRFLAACKEVSNPALCDCFESQEPTSSKHTSREEYLAAVSDLIGEKPTQGALSITPEPVWNDTAQDWTVGFSDSDGQLLEVRHFVSRIVAANFIEGWKHRDRCVPKESDELALVAASRVLANTYPQTSSQSLQVDAHAWECFKAELDKLV